MHENEKQIVFTSLKREDKLNFFLRLEKIIRHTYHVNINLTHLRFLTFFATKFPIQNRCQSTNQNDVKNYHYSSRRISNAHNHYQITNLVLEYMVVSASASALI